MEKRELSYMGGRNVNRYNHYGKQYKFLKNLKIELPYDPAIPCLSIHPEKNYNFFFFVLFVFLGLHPVVYGGFQARSSIGAVALGLHQSLIGFANAKP